VVVFTSGTVYAHGAGFLGKVIIIGGQQATVAETAEILGGEKAESSEMADGAAGYATVFCAEGLGGILNDIEVVGTRKVHEWVHVGGLAIEMDGDDGSGFLGDTLGGVVGIKVEAGRADVAKDWGGTCTSDAAGGSDEGEGGAQHFVAGAYVEGHEGKQEGIGAGGNSNRVLCTKVIANLIFEVIYFRAENKLAGLQHAVECSLEFGLKGAVLFP